MESENIQEKSSIIEFISNAVWAFKEMFRIAFWDMTSTFIITLVLGALPTLRAFVYSKTIDELLRLVSLNSSVENSLQLNQPFVWLIIASLGVSLFDYIFNRFKSYIKSRFSKIHFQNYEAELMLKTSKYDLKTFENKDYADLIKKGQNNLWKVNNFVDSTVRIITNLVDLVLSGIIVFTASPSLFGVLFILGVPSGLVSFAYAKKWFSLEDLLLESYRKKGSLSSNIVNEEKIPQNRVLNISSYLFSKFNILKDNIVEKEINLQKRQEAEYFLWNIPYFLGGSISMLYFSIQFILRKISFGDLNFLTSRASAFSSRLDNVLNDISILFDNGLYLKTVRRLFNIFPDIKSGHLKVNSTKPPLIEFKDLTFKYPGSQKYVFKNFNLSIYPGDEIAIVGENGAGKTTLIKLLLRIYEIDSGDILINGKSIKNLNLQSYYNLFGVLFQEYSFYNSLTIKENIIIPDKVPNKKKYSTALIQSQAGKFIERLEEKDNSVLNKSFKGGVTLSTGQYQKLALARVFYKDSPILILDEPTASIDPVSEYKIFKRIYSFIKRKTLIIISHRFSTVRNAKKIFVLDKGKIIEQGSHEELLKLNGVYADAFIKQAEGYTN